MRNWDGWKRDLKGGALCVLLIVAMSIVAGCMAQEPPTSGGAPGVRRLTEDQYRNTIADVFGSKIVVAGRFDPLPRVEGLLTVGASKAAITSSALERYEALAHNIAAQVVDSSNRDFLINCKPRSAQAPDETCARQFLNEVGRLLFRRPLSAREVRIHLDIANKVAASLEDFYAGLAYSLAGMLTSPSFLFVTDVTEPDPQRPGARRLNGYSVATRLSFFLWNTTPNSLLLDAAERGDLHTPEGLEREVDRLLSSPRLEASVRAFFSDMLEFERFNTLAKDAEIYPAFSASVAMAAPEQTLRTLVDHVLTRDEDYRDLFTSTRTFLTGPLGLLYRVPIENPDRWTPFEFAAGDFRVGLHTQLSFLAMHSHAGKSSPTLRGRAVRELMMCQKVPDPPGNVDFTLFLSGTTAKTARERLRAHNENATCASCHKITDPIGLTLETFDGAGQFRTEENNAPIDTTGDLDGSSYSNAAGLGRALRNHPAVPSCLVQRLYSYAAGRAPNRGEVEWMTRLGEEFAEENYRLVPLMRYIAMSQALYRVNDSTNEDKSSVRTSAVAAGERGNEG